MRRAQKAYVELMAKRTLYFLRHGESDWNVERLCIGQFDRPLTERGRAQALAAGARCRSLGLELIFHSPLSRAADTAQAISQATGARLQVEPSLIEANLGEKQGAREDLEGDPFFQRWLAGTQFQGAETFAALRLRAKRSMLTCLARCPLEAGAPLIVGHSAFFRALCVQMKRLPIAAEHCVPYQLEIETEQP
ncbi:histidine phosphatase family protein [Phenylobacterium sp.]|uniref:histidine phosphatase family protein n=1 Tax=Phenylobacterium sp. TaxID=1871053 RepID=UPI0035B1688F